MSESYTIVSPTFHYNQMVGFDGVRLDRQRMNSTRYHLETDSLAKALAIFYNRMGRFTGSTGMVLELKGAEDVLDGSRRSLSDNEYIVAHLRDGDPLADAIIWIKRS